MDYQTDDQLSDWVDEKLAAGRTATDWVPSTAEGLTRFRQRRQAYRRTQRKAAWVAAGAIALSVATLSFPATRVYAQLCAQACVVETSRVTQFILDRVHPKPSARVARQTAPDFTLVDSEGRTVQLASLRGKVVLLNFWATWCRPCGVEIPWFMEFQKEYAGRGLSVVGVSVDEDGWNSVRPFIARLGVNYPVVVGGDEIVQLFGGLDSLPTTLIIDRSGRVAVTHVGLVSRQTYEDDVRAVLNENGAGSSRSPSVAMSGDTAR